MNWYQHIKVARDKGFKDLPLPTMQGVPDDMSPGTLNIDESMREEIAGQERAKYPDMSYVGGGSYGGAFTALENQVVKYTTDADEAKSAGIIKELQEQGQGNWAAKVYAVAELQQGIAYQTGNWPIYAIVLERLEELNNAEEWIIQKAMRHRLGIEKEEVYLYAIRSTIDLRESYKLDRELPPRGEVDFPSDEMIRDVLAHYREMIIEMRKDKALPGDAHQLNIGKKNGRYLLFDLGGTY